LPYANPSAFMAAAAERAALLPTELKTTLTDLNTGRVPSGVLLVRGLPLDRDLCATPSEPALPSGPPGKRTSISEALLSLCASHLGFQVGYAQEAGGLMWQQIVSRQRDAHLQTSTGYKQPLEFHGETCFHPHRPAFLLLHGLRGDRDGRAETHYATAGDLVPLLAQEDLEELVLPQFRLGIDVSFGGGTMPDPVAVLVGEGHDLRFRFDADLMHGRTPAAKRALHNLGLVARARRRSVVLDAGDLLVVDNRVTIHGRSAYAPRHDGLDRWLQRAFVVSDLPRAEHMLPGTSVITGPLPGPG
jgi:L-asparagine oxygenase